MGGLTKYYIDNEAAHYAELILVYGNDFFVE